MRSRDGNHTFTCRFLSLILWTSLALNASEFLISYRYVVKDATLYNETLQISKAMQKCHGTPQNSIILDATSTDELKDILSTNNEEFINYIHHLGLDVLHKEKTSNYQNSSTTILTLKTTCFTVDFNDNFAKISALK